MKKISIVLGAALIMAGAAFAGDGNKSGCCSKGKKEACSTEKKVAHEKGGACCKKDGKASASNVDVKKAPTKEAKSTNAVKKS